MAVFWLLFLYKNKKKFGFVIKNKKIVRDCMAKI